MSLSELLLTFMVAILVFGPKQLPLLASHLSQAMHLMQRLRRQVNNFWQEQLNEQQLKENTQKALHADKVYEQSNNECAPRAREQTQ